MADFILQVLIGFPAQFIVVFLTMYGVHNNY